MTEVLIEMGYEVVGRLHAAWVSARREHGQGTVEYVGLILLIAVILAGVVKASGGFSDKAIATEIVSKLKDAIGDVGGSSK